mmetsp:Transcript_133976/g.232597  ORF Transcript_133976/g.232597 Transcript_133976/m.232597 type:complete len:174 (-) Transcript_133976:794-1315(-)
MGRKLPTSVDPNNTTWAKDKSRFGFMMLQKMGWKEGTGLGKDLQGSTEHIKVKQLDERVGLGGEVENVSWTIHKENYDKILAKLQTKVVENSADTSDSEPTTPSSLVRARDFDDAEQARKRQKKQAKKQMKLELEKQYMASGLSAEDMAKQKAADKQARKDARAAKRASRRVE